MISKSYFSFILDKQHYRMRKRSIGYRRKKIADYFIFSPSLFITPKRNILNFEQIIKCRKIEQQNDKLKMQ